jgi:hypothetical protein
VLSRSQTPSVRTFPHGASKFDRGVAVGCGDLPEDRERPAVLATTERLREQIAEQVVARRTEPSRSLPENQVDDRRGLICEQTRKMS